MARKIQIAPVLNGFIVSVGCKTVVFTDITVMTDAIARYYRAPQQVEKDYLAAAINKIDLDNPQPTPDCGGIQLQEGQEIAPPQTTERRRP